MNNRTVPISVMDCNKNTAGEMEQQKKMNNKIAEIQAAIRSIEEFLESFSSLETGARFRVFKSYDQPERL